jgi:hypothetical protein
MRGLLLVVSLSLAGCAGAGSANADSPSPRGTAADDGGAAITSAESADLDGTWRVADATLGTLSVKLDGDDGVITSVDGVQFEFDGRLSRKDGQVRLSTELEVGTPGLKVLFGPPGTGDVEGTINFAMGHARALFARQEGAPFITARFWRASRPADTLKEVRLTPVTPPAAPPPASTPPATPSPAPAPQAAQPAAPGPTPTPVR